MSNHAVFIRSWHISQKSYLEDLATPQRHLTVCGYAVLQFVLEGIMPQSYNLMPPHYLLLTSYVYIFGLVGLAICSNSLATQWQRRSQ